MPRRLAGKGRPAAGEAAESNASAPSMGIMGNGTSAAASGYAHHSFSDRQTFLEVYRYWVHSSFLVKDFCTFGGYMVEG